jgi:hypothetical protein
MSKNNRFSIEYQYQQYLAKTGLTEDTMHPQQKEQLRRTFYAASGQMLVLLRDDVTKLPERLSVVMLQSLLNQVSRFFEKAIANQNKQSKKQADE